MFVEPRRRVETPTLYAIRRAIESWLKEKSCDLQKAFGDEEFYAYVEAKVDAANYFKSKEDFISSVNGQLERMAM